ncbi:MAG: glycoside hydrolase family 31 protein [Bacteroidota bacterium]
MNFKSVTSKSLGHLKSFTRSETEITGTTDYGHFKITLYTPSIIRVCISSEPQFEDFSYSIIRQPTPSIFDLVDDSDEVLISTSETKLVFSKNPVRFTFTDLHGNIVNEDDKGLGTAWIGEQSTTYKKLQDGERFIGLGEKTGHLDRKGSGYQNWNTDAYGYHSGTDPLYCSTPFYIGIHHQLVYGIFLDNTHKTFFNFGASNNRFASFSADAGEMNYYFLAGKSVAQIIQQYTWLTGRMELPPLWSIAYQQCRYSYYPDTEVLNVARTFREKKIPADTIVFDIHYMDKYKIFTWDSKNFANPKAMIDALKEMGFEVVIMCDPGIKMEEGYEPYEDGVRKNAFLKYPDGENYSGQVWPGWCHFPDFTNALTREWWAEKFKSYVDIGVEGFWNDMNEIATWGNTLPENIEFDFDGNKATTRRGRNVYGFQMARSTYEGTKKLLNGKRPFNLTRSAFSGVQRYSAVWTGDNVAYDEHMMLGIRLVNSMGLTGIAFAGYDVGGFVGDASSKLFARWISIGALSPFFRGHSMINSRDSEPWSYGEEVEQIARNYIRLRYQLLPYIYSLFHDASQTGMPVQRSLAIGYSFNARIYDHQFQHQYLFGPSILVAPVESNKDVTKVYLPAGEWYYLHDSRKIDGEQDFYMDCPIHKLPVFIKAGAILPMQRAVSHTKEKVDQLDLHIYAGKEDSSFELYEDDGSTFRYQTGAFSKRSIHFRSAKKKIILDETEGSFESLYSKIKLVLHGFSMEHINLGQQHSSVQKEKTSFFIPYEKYDPIHDPEKVFEEDVLTFVFQNQKSKIEISW